VSTHRVISVTLIPSPCAGGRRATGDGEGDGDARGAGLGEAATGRGDGDGLGLVIGRGEGEGLVAVALVMAHCWEGSGPESSRFAPGQLYRVVL
jgi:hypothetical protein